MLKNVPYRYEYKITFENLQHWATTITLSEAWAGNIFYTNYRRIMILIINHNFNYIHKFAYYC